MKKLILYRLEIEGGTTLPKHLVYAKTREEGRKIVEALFGHNYPYGKWKVRDSATQVFDDAIDAENGIGPGCGILGTLHPSQKLEFLEDFSRSNTKRRHGSGLHKMLMDELKKERTLEKKRKEKETRQWVQTEYEGGRDLNEEEKQFEGTI